MESHRIHSGIQHCRQHHSVCRLLNVDSAPKPLRFLNVNSARSAGEVCLVDADPEITEPYITLSYVWGKDQPAKTTLATRTQHKSGITIAPLPKTIRDAIQVARYLGVDLLWVDSLCIIQDDIEELAREIANMSSYYGNSLITISAAAAPSCEAGFLGPNPRTNDRFFGLPFISGGGGPGSVRLLPERKPPSEVIDTRAWTLQEGLMATRLVSIGEDRISWSCLSADYGEIKISHLRNLFHKAKTLSMVVPNITERLDGTLDSASLMRLQYLDVWHEIACEYCERHLSNVTDSLVAISGIASEFSALIQDRTLLPPYREPRTLIYAAGLWGLACLSLQLLWEQSLPRTPQHEWQYTDKNNYIVPPWSWAANRAGLRRHKENYLIWLAGARTDTFNILSCDVELRDKSAPFGALCSAYMMARGPTFETDLESIFEPEDKQRYGITVNLDAVCLISSQSEFLAFESFIPESALGTITLLEIVSRPPITLKGRNMEDFPRGLVLSKNMDGPYQQLGVYFKGYGTGRFVERKIPWKEKELKLV